MADRDGVERVRAALDGHGIELKSHADGSWRGRCPVHQGETRDSLSLRHHTPRGSDRGRVQLRCWGGCDERDVLALVGLDLADLYDDPPPRLAGTVVREHVYLDGGANLVGVVRRTEPKSFRPATPTEKGWRTASSEQLKTVPYRLPAVVAAIASEQEVYVTEGERDADTLAAHGVAATCNTEGAGKFSAAHARWLAGAHVVICGDRDDAGRRHVAKVVELLQGVAASVRIVEPAEGKDVTDHLAAGRTLDELVTVERPKDSAGPTRPRRWTASALLAARFPEPKWAVPNLIPMGLTVLAGPPKVGKSWLTLGLAVAITTGGKALDYQAVVRGPVLYLALEDSEIRLQNRLEDLLGQSDAPDNLHLWPSIERGQAGLVEINDWLIEHPSARMVIVDVLQRFRGDSGSRSDDRYAADYAALTGLKAVADAHQVAVVVVHHTRKSSDGDFLQEVSGTNGIAGSADTVIVLRRDRTVAAGKLAITGRDVIEDEHEVELIGCRWKMTSGPAVIEQMPPTRRAIFDAVKAAPGPVRPVDVAKAISKGRDTIRKTMQRMGDAAELATDGRGRYWIPTDLGHIADPGHPWDTSESNVSADQAPAGTPGTPTRPPASTGPGQPLDKAPLAHLSQVSQEAADQQKRTESALSQECPTLSQAPSCSACSHPLPGGGEPGDICVGCFKAGAA